MTAAVEAGGPPESGVPAPEGTGIPKRRQTSAVDVTSGLGTIGDHLRAATDYRVTSQQVSWWSVHEYIAAVLERRGSWPAAGTLSAGK